MEDNYYRIVELEEKISNLKSLFRFLKEQVYGNRLPQYEYDLEEDVKWVIKEVEDEEGKL